MIETLLSPFEQEEVKAFGLVNIAAYGVLDLSVGRGTYFSFSRIPGPISIRHGKLLEMVVPYLHHALIRTICTSPALVESNARLSFLTSREQEILSLLGAGLTNREIASKLARSELTVQTHVHSILKKLDVTSRSGAIALMRGSPSGSILATQIEMGRNMRRKIPRLFTVLTLMLVHAIGSATIVGPNTKILPNQIVSSDDGAYWLIMQYDGNLVLYRRDNSVVWNTQTFVPGTYAFMQNDGNFVEYNSSGQPVWTTYTGGNPGAYLNVQTDGNLVIYNSAGAPLWNIGADLQPATDPSQIGDVVGRDMANIVMGVFGHLGIWTGANVAQVMPGRANAVEIVSLANFKSQVAPEKYWGAARPNIPNYTITNCFAARCTNFATQPWGQAEAVSTRTAIFKWIYQAQAIGASYSYQPGYEYADPGDYYRPAKRGLYRCDSFVVSILYSTIERANVYPAANNTWWYRMNQLFASPRSPATLFPLIKSFN